MTKSNIGWTNEVWNPVTGCSHVSPGCLNCYAETLSLRRGWSKKPWTAQNATENVVLHPDRLDYPLGWRSPRLVFVNSMSDLFHERVPDDFIAAVFNRMSAARQHVFQVLTKRPERMLRWIERVECEAVAFKRRYPNDDAGAWVDETLGMMCRRGNADSFNETSREWPLPNVWLGVSVEDQRRADERIPLLLDTPAVVRWISAEPLLGPLDLGPYLCDGIPTQAQVNGSDGDRYVRDGASRLDWLVVGGESGPDYRRMDVEWASDAAAQCLLAGVPVFVKQDSGAKPGKQGRLPDRLWSLKQFPVAIPTKEPV